MPHAADKILKQLNVENAGDRIVLAEFGGMPVGGNVGTAEILFSRVSMPRRSWAGDRGG